jgi:HEAT repeat protein
MKILSRKNGLNSWILILVAIGLQNTTGFAQNTSNPDIHTLVTQLDDVKTIGPDTERQILALARRDPAARRFVASRIPDLISRPTDDAWLIAVRLAGELKAPEAIPSLQAAMSRPPFPAVPYISSGVVMRLDNDIVARSLSQIGAPAIPSVVALLKSQDEQTRGRAILILRNMGSRAARAALRDRLSHETDTNLRKLIEDSLAS